MKHLDLFSGIGGFALAADTVFGDVEHTFVENDLFCQEVLKKHWPNSKIYGDIRGLSKDQLIADTYREEPRGVSKGEREGVPEAWKSGIDILTGGFPCQPFSQAGRRKGTADDRYLWPEMFRVIREFKPTWVIAENVRGLVTWNEGMVLEQVCADLESESYEVQPLIIPAVAVNAPHRRDRVWIVAHLNTNGSRPHEHVPVGEGKSTGMETEIERTDNNASDTGRERRSEGSDESVRPESEVSEWQDGSVGSWEWDWKEVATATCDVRMDDGVPKRMDRNPQLKALGNAIVPQVAEEIMRSISQVDK